MTLPYKAKVESLATATNNSTGTPVRSKVTVHTAMPCQAEVATPKSLATFAGKFERAVYVLTWRQSGLKAGQILTLNFDAKEYMLKAVKYDQLGAYYTGVLEGVS